MNIRKKILVVDHLPNTRITFKELIRGWGFELVMAMSGDEAWDIIQEKQISFIICHIDSMGLDGVSLCHKIKEAYLGYPTYIILFGSLKDKERLIHSVSVGADDFLTRPFNNGELKARIDSGKRLLKLQNEVSEKNSELESAYQKLSEDLDTVGKMQNNLLPSTQIEEIDFKWLFKPSKYAGGDIFNLFNLDEKNFAFYSLDVAGHGIPSAMLSFSLHSVITQEYCKDKNNEIYSPHEVVARLNDQFQTDDNDDLYFTMVYGIYNIDNHELQFCHAAHPHPILVSPQQESRLIGDGGFPIGLIPQAVYETTTMQLTRGDRLVFHSDGITECTNDTEEQFGEERLLEFFKQQQKQPLEDNMYDLHDLLKDWRGGKYEFTDDISLIAWEVK